MIYDWRFVIGDWGLLAFAVRADAVKMAVSSWASFTLSMCCLQSYICNHKSAIIDFSARLSFPRPSRRARAHPVVPAHPPTSFPHPLPRHSREGGNDETPWE